MRAFGIGFEHRGLRDVAARTTFLVDGAGVIRDVWRYEPGDVPELEEWVASARALNAAA